MSLKKSFIDTTQKFKVTFELPVTENNTEKEVRVVGDFNDWNWDAAPTMSISENYYKVDIELLPGKKYEYRYLINNEHWANDNNADDYSPSPCDDINNCVLILDAPDSALDNTASPSKSTSNLRTRTIDFTKIKDLTVDIKILLNGAGIKTYRQLADTSVETLSSILGKQNFDCTPAHFYLWVDMAEKLDEEDW